MRNYVCLSQERWGSAQCRDPISHLSSWSTSYPLNLAFGCHRYLQIFWFLKNLFFNEKLLTFWSWWFGCPRSCFLQINPSQALCIYKLSYHLLEIVSKSVSIGRWVATWSYPSSSQFFIITLCLSLLPSYITAFGWIFW